MKIMRSLLLASAILFMFNASASANGQLEKYQATFIYNFTRLVQWPNMHDQPTFVIGVLGRNQAITAELHLTAKDRSVGGRTIQVVEYASTDEVGDCHVLFVPNNRLNQLKRANEIIGKKPVLVITEFQGRHPAESVINLSLENDRLGYRLDEENAKQRNLLVSSQLTNYSR